tara:strand:- start:3353 stop:3571 length:219 start_codon:yes stop_codon:yes gene_type:complete
MSGPKGLGRLQAWEPVDLGKVGEGLSLRRLNDAERDKIIDEATQAINEAKTARAMGKALGKVLNAVAARYGA